MRDRAQKSYDAIAPEYARRNQEMGDAYREWLQRFEHMCPEGPLVDLGCGAGRDAAALRATGRVVVGGDLSGGMLSQARKSFDGPLVQADAANLPFRRNSFSGVLLAATLLHFPKRDVPWVLREARSSLCPGGILALTVPIGDVEGWELIPYDALKHKYSVPTKRWYSYWEIPDLTAALSDARFDAAHVTTIEHYRPWAHLLSRKQIR